MKKLVVLSTLAAAAFGAQAVTLFQNGPVVGSNGLSVIAANSSLFGLGAQTTALNTVADDFTVTSGQTWTIESINFYAYQTGATAFPFTAATWSIVSGDVNTGSVVASGTTSLTNAGLVGYRVSSTALTDTTRRIFNASADITDIALGEGTYWLRWSLAGSASFSGPWAPLSSDGAVGNAVQATAGGSFITPVDQTFGEAFITLPFTLNGTVSAVPEPASVALMLVGALGVAGVARRRSRQA